MHKAYWQLEYERNKDFAWQNLREDLFGNWEQWRSPDMKAEMELDMALRCLYADQKELGRQYLRRAIAVAERALKEDKCRSERCRGDYPLNEGHLMRALAYATGLFGEPIDPRLLLDASERVERECGQVRKRDWDEMVECIWLGAVRLALLAGDGARARHVLTTRKRKLREANRLEERLLAELAAGGHASPSGEPLRSDLTALFERVRDPRYRHPQPADPVLWRLELGALRDKYFVSGDGAIDWNRVIEAVSA